MCSLHLEAPTCFSRMSESRMRAAHSANTADFFAAVRCSSFLRISRYSPAWEGTRRSRQRRRSGKSQEAPLVLLPSQSYPEAPLLVSVSRDK